jgi:subtilase family serine protease
VKTIYTAASYALFAAIIVLTGCGASQSGSKIAGGVVPAANSIFGVASAPRHRKIIAACPHRRPGKAQCQALILDGMPIKDGGSGPAGGFAPADLQSAYNLPSSSRGSGQIVAIVDAYDSPNAASDLATYRSYFGLPAANFYKFNQYGQQYNYPESCTDSPDNWCPEFAIDPQMVSASCPNCTIYLIEANTDSAADLDAAEADAVTLGAHIVTNSWGFFCPSSCDFQKSYFDTPGVVYLASAGDSGYGIMQPMEFGSVVSVGGTHLVKGGGKRGWSESVWGGGGFGPGNFGTGGGCSFVQKPSWQHDPGCTSRTANDVAAVADTVTGVAIYDTYGQDGTGWITAGGTSVASPLIAGIFGLAGNATSQNGGRTFWEKRHQNLDDLNPVLRGSNGHCSPTYFCTDGTLEYKDYGGPTGWGTPNGIGAF